MPDPLEGEQVFTQLPVSELTAVLHALPAAICIYDEHDNIVFWNEKYFEFFPWHRGEMFVGRPYEDALRVFFEKNLADDELPNLERHLAAGIKRHRELKAPFVFQTYQGIWVSVTPHRMQNGLYMKVWTEVTPNVVSTDEYRNLLDTMTAIHVGFCFFDADGRFVLSNQRLSEMMPDAVHVFTPGRPFGDFIRSCVRTAFTDAGAVDLLAISERRFPVDTTVGPLSIRTRDGTYLDYEESRTGTGGLIAVWTDVTARRETEQRLRDSEAQARAARDATAKLNAELESRIESRTRDLTRALEIAQRSDAAKTRVLSNVSHELRTPLNAILGFSQMMSDRFDIGPLPPEKYREYSVDIMESAEYLLNLIDNLLKMSALESDTRLDDIDPLPVADLFDTCDTMLRPMAVKAGVTLTFSVAPDVPAVLASKRGLTQVILNLGSNALRYTPTGGTLSVTAVPADADRVRIAVADTGAGMTPEQLASVGDPFSGEQYVRTDTKRGAGIGIPLSTLLVQSMRGEIAFDSVLGKGTTATITLPAA